MKNKMDELLKSHPNRREEIIFYEPFAWLNEFEIEDVEMNPTIMESWTYTLQYMQDIEEFAQAGSGISYLGTVGVGKTMQMGVLFKMACFTGRFRPCNWVYTHELIASFASQRREWDRDKFVRDFVLHSKVLFIDDIGVENDTAYIRSILEGVFVERYNKRFATCLTSNLSIDEFGQRYGQRIVDRLNQTNRTFELVGDSYRKPIGDRG